MKDRFLALCVAVVVLAGLAWAGDQPKGKAEAKKEKDDSYIKVEAKGKLLTGITAVGGETTGVMIQTGVGSFELELDKKQEAEAKKLDGKAVIVTGSIVIKPGVTRGPRTLIQVASLREAK